MRLRSVSDIYLNAAQDAIPIHLVPDAKWPDFCEAAGPRMTRWLQANGFKGQQARLILCPDTQGGLEAAVLGLGAAEDALAAAQCAAQLPAGDYVFDASLAATAPDHLALSWALGAYAFDAYKSAGPKARQVRLVWPDGARKARVEAAAEAVWSVRDWINMPAADMNPQGLEDAVRAVAARHGASVETIAGDALLEQNFPMVHAVGRASSVAPRLITMTWGPHDAPALALVGKGVCFDTGGLDIKPAASMLTMRKDMGGAACVLGLAHMIMVAGWRVRLSVYVPAVENSVAGNAFRPGDILKSRKGLTVEIGNTDAEGRLILADALTLAEERAPDTLVCMATLTGAARVATGFDIPPFFTDDEDLAARVMAASKSEADPMWRLPLWKPYQPLIEGKSADLNNSPDSPNAGAITAALFLSRFVAKDRRFLHTDIAAWTDRAKPGRPLGAEATAMRALFAALEGLYAA
jgi:leucyl aminopeptidase